MNFEEFKNNIESWAEARGIYEHSTPEAQLLKTLSEAGELADAKIKGDTAGMMDAIGDVAVCMVNYAKMSHVDITDDSFIAGASEISVSLKNLDEMIGVISLSVGMLLCPSQAEEDVGVYVYMVLASLACISRVHLWHFMDCCESAWNEIKDRRGFLSKKWGVY